MNVRQIWVWLVLAAALFAFIFFVQRHKPPPSASPGRILPELKAAAVTSLQVRPSGSGSLGIRVERANDTWQLVEPLVYPAQGTNVDRLLQTLESLVPATYITPAEIRQRANPDAAFGFTAPQASIIVQQGDYRAHVLVGNLTAPGDQVYLQVVAREGVYVVDAGWLKCLPRSANEWRDTAVVSGDPASVDRLAVTNNARSCVLQRDTNTLWKMVWPLSAARADSPRIEEALLALAQLRVGQFVSDDPKPDLEPLGLAKPELELALSRGAQTPLLLQFGKPVPAATNQVYARKFGHKSIFTVSSETLAPWRGASVNDFRDSHLLTLTDPVATIDIHGRDDFSLQRQADGSWNVLPAGIPADGALVSEFLSTLTSLQIAQFVKDVVNPPELPEFGLASPALIYKLRAAVASTNALPADATNGLITELDFGFSTNAPDKVCVRRTDETAVYAIATNDFARLPSAGWQLRERRLWNVSEEEISGLAIQQAGKTREMVRRGDHLWSLAPGSQGIINDLAVEETVRGLLGASARCWVDRGTGRLERFGLEKPHRVTLVLKSGARLQIDFGGSASQVAQYAAVSVAGETYVMEFPWVLYRDVTSYLSIP